MALIQARTLPPGQDQRQFDDLKKDDLAMGHMTLGLVYLATKKDAESGKEFMLSVDTAPNPNPLNLLRAGMAFNNARQFDQANAAFDRFLKTPNLPAQYKTYVDQERARQKAMQQQK
jgi:tetratricopeptide (TPR) repeat protein